MGTPPGTLHIPSQALGEAVEPQQLVADGGHPGQAAPAAAAAAQTCPVRGHRARGGGLAPARVPGDRLQEPHRREGSMLEALGDTGSCIPACSYTLQGLGMAKGSPSITKDKGNGVL